MHVFTVGHDIVDGEDECGCDATSCECNTTDFYAAVQCFRYDPAAEGERCDFRADGACYTLRAREKAVLKADGTYACATAAVGDAIQRVGNCRRQLAELTAHQNGCDAAAAAAAPEAALEAAPGGGNTGLVIGLAVGGAVLAAAAVAAVIVLRRRAAGRRRPVLSAFRRPTFRMSRRFGTIRPTS